MVERTVTARPRADDHVRVRAIALALLLALLGASTAEARWTSPRVLPDSTGAAAQPRVAMGLNGTVAVAFVRQGVRVAVRRDGGQIAPTTLVSSERRAVSSPDVAISGRGDIVAVWVQARSTRLPLQPPYRVRAISYVPKRGWGRPKTLGWTPYFDSAAPRIVANARGDAAIAWRCVRGGILGTSSDTVCVTARRAGHRFGSVAALAQRSGVTAVEHQQVAVDPSGGVHVAWTSLPGPRVRYAYRGRSGRWSAPRTLSSVPASRPRMVAAVDGAVVVAWHEAPPESAETPVTYGPLAAAVRTRAGRFSPARTISTTPIFEPELAAGPSGDVLLTWSTPRGVEPSLPGWDSVHWALRGRGTSDIGDAAVADGVADGSPSFAPTGRLGFLADGTALLAVGGPGGVRVVKRPPGGTFATTQLIAPAGDLPQLVTRRGHAAVVFATESRLGEVQLRISVRG